MSDVDPTPGSGSLDDLSPGIHIVLKTSPSHEERAAADKARRELRLKLGLAEAESTMGREFRSRGFSRSSLFFSTVAGVNHANADGSSRAQYIRAMEVTDQLRLVRDVANLKSSHAVAIETLDGRRVGFLPDSLAAEVSPDLDRGDLFTCRIAEFAGGTKRRPHLVVSVAIEQYKKSGQVIQQGRLESAT